MKNGSTYNQLILKIRNPILLSKSGGKPSSFLGEKHAEKQRFKNYTTHRSKVLQPLTCKAEKKRLCVKMQRKVKYHGNTIL